MSEIKQLASLNSHNLLLLRFIVSKKKEEMVEITYEIIRGKKVKTFILFKEQTEKLKEIDVNVINCDYHHLVQKTLRNRLNEKLSEETRNSVKRNLDSLKREIDFSLVISLPYDIHQTYNDIFRGCIIPRTVLEKLDLILEEEELNGKYKKDVINLFTFIAVLTKEISRIDIEEVSELKKSNDGIVTVELLRILGIAKEDVYRCISGIFFYPEHEKMSKHFDILSELYNS